MSKDDDSSSNNRSSSDQYLEFSGTVETICRDRFLVAINDSNMKVLCTCSGKIRVSGVKILPGDSVELLVSAYDTSMGRIVYRNKV